MVRATPIAARQVTKSSLQAVSRKGGAAMPLALAGKGVADRLPTDRAVYGVVQEKTKELGGLHSEVKGRRGGIST